MSNTIPGNGNRRPVVVIALGAIESARTALVSLAGMPNGNQVGANFLVHLRKNASFTVPLPAGLALADQELSALLVVAEPISLMAPQYIGIFRSPHQRCQPGRKAGGRRLFAVSERARPGQYPLLFTDRSRAARRFHSGRGRDAAQPSE